MPDFFYYFFWLLFLFFVFFFSWKNNLIRSESPGCDWRGGWGEIEKAGYALQKPMCLLLFCWIWRNGEYVGIVFVVRGSLSG